METEISAELKDELRFIEKETRLLSHTPQSMRAFSVILWCVFAAVLIAVTLAMKNGNYLSVLFFLFLGGFLIGTHFHQKKLFNMYSDASEIVSYYKQKQNPKGDPHFDSTTPPQGIMP